MRFILSITLLFIITSELKAETETEALMRLKKEVNYLTQQVKKTKALAQPGQKISFNYKKLIIELEKVDVAIDEYTKRVERLPRIKEAD